MNELALQRTRAPGRRRSSSRLTAVALALALLATAPTSVLSRPGSSGPRGEIDEALAALAAQVDPAIQIPVIVSLRDQPDLRGGGFGRRGDAGRVARELHDVADRSQPAVLALIARHVAAGTVSGIRRIWITNAIALRATPAVIRELAASPLVAAIDLDRLVAGPEAALAADAAPVEPNISTIGAPDLWAAGIRGAGTVVASMDTGVDINHPDLSSRFRGGANSWFDPYGQHPAGPVDLNGHGTQTLGVAVGGDAGGTSIGVAPGAQWIAAKAFADNGFATTSGLHLAFQWLLDPDGNPATEDEPDVVNASWGLGSPGCDLTFEPDLGALLAGGIVPVVAAGNTGPGSGSGSSPANNPSAYSVGAVDTTDLVASFSARGPDGCGTAAPAPFPDVVAAGVAIRTSERFGLFTSATGTSIAAPHVAGAVALLREAFPDASPVQLEAAISGGAVDLGPAGADNAYGAGRLDVRAARALLGGGPPPPPPSPTPSSSPTPTPSGTTPPATGPVALAPNPTAGRSPVVFSALVQAGSGDTVVAAEMFVDVAGPAGTGRPMGGTWGASSASASGTLSISDLAALPEGTHRLFVHGRGALGGWGPLAEGALIVDRTAPALSAATATPPSSLGAGTIGLTVDASDGIGPIARGEWFIGADPGTGSASQLTAADGSFDEPAEGLAGMLGTPGLSYGDVVPRLRAADVAGNWSPTVGLPILVTPADAIFADGFERGLSRWSSTVGGGRLSIDPAFALSGDVGLGVTFGAQAACVVDGSPAAAAAYRARIRLDAGTATTAGKTLDLLAARSGSGETVVSVQYRRGSSGGPEIELFVAKRKGSTTSPWLAIGQGPHSVEISWTSATSASVVLSIDGTARATMGPLDTSSFRIEEVRVGQTQGLTNAASGRMKIDGFVSTRTTPIGK